jgi:hypothetical protein
MRAAETHRMLDGVAHFVARRQIAEMEVQRKRRRKDAQPSSPGHNGRKAARGQPLPVCRKARRGQGACARPPRRSDFSRFFFLRISQMFPARWPAPIKRAKPRAAQDKCRSNRTVKAVHENLLSKGQDGPSRRRSAKARSELMRSALELQSKIRTACESPRQRLSLPWECF